MAGIRAAKPIVKAFLVGLVLFNIVTFLIATRHGIGISPDGVFYLGLAREFRSEGSFYLSAFGSPTHFPPGYGLTVGTLSLILGTSVETAAWFFQLVLVSLLPILTAKAMAGPTAEVTSLHVIASGAFCLGYQVVWDLTLCTDRSGLSRTHDVLPASP